MEMDVTITVALYSLLSATLAAFITAKLNSIYNHQLKQIEYRNAYYQKLIDKRLAGLDELRDILPYFQDSKLIEEEFTTIRSIYYHTPSIYRKTYPIIADAFNNTMWLSGSAYQSGIKLRNIFHEINEEIVKAHFDPEEIYEIGLKNDKRLFTAAKEFHFFLIREYFTVHDFDSLKSMYEPKRISPIEKLTQPVKRLFGK